MPLSVPGVRAEAGAAGSFKMNYVVVMTIKQQAVEVG